jgi:hypothetical protein
MWKVAVVLGVLGTGIMASARAEAYSYDTFYGWSADGSYYAYGWSGTDESSRPVVCLSDAKAGSKTWPKGLARPEDDEACVSMCQDDTDYECNARSEPRVRKWVTPPKSAKKGPHGETVSVTVHGMVATFRVLRGGKEVASATREAEQSVEGYALAGAYWQPGGGGHVAVLLDVAPHKPTRQELEDEKRYGPAPGYPAPRYLEVMTLHAPYERAAAKAANVRGLQLHRDKRYAEAVPAYRAAIAADASYVFAHYNLACAAALLGDRATARAELQWLREHDSDPDAQKMLAKGQTDADLAPVRDDTDVRVLLALPLSCAQKCDVEQQRCQDDCDETGEAPRACGFQCSEPYEACAAKCAAAK